MRILTVLLLLVSCGAAAQSTGISLPGQSYSSSYDEIRTSGGTTCKTAIGSPLNVEFGVIGSDAETGRNHHSNTQDYTSGSQGNAAYARISYALGTKPRLDCSRVLELEIEVLREELMLLRNSFQD